MTAHRDGKRPLILADAQELLPWYLKGKIARSQNDAIDSMLKGSADLREQLRTAQSRQAAMIESNDNVGNPTAVNLIKLLQRIEITKQQHYAVASEPDFFNRMLGTWTVSRPLLKFAFVTTCALMIALGVFFYRLSPSSTKSTVGNEVLVVAPAASLIVSFSADATAAQLSQMLAEVDAKVIDGPMPGQTFILDLNDAATLDAAIAKLRSHPELVISAQRR